MRFTDPRSFYLAFIFIYRTVFFLKTFETLKNSLFYVTCNYIKGVYRTTGIGKLLAVTRQLIITLKLLIYLKFYCSVLLFNYFIYSCLQWF